MSTFILITEKNKMKYIGVKKRRNKRSQYFFVVDFFKDGVRHNFGRYKDPKDAAKAHDLYVIKKNLDRETNFIKKKLA